MARQVIATAYFWFVVTMGVLNLIQPAAADCGHFFRQKVVYQQQYYTPAYVQPIVYAPLVFYQAGDELRIQAAVKRELEYQQQLQAPSKSYQSPQQAPIQAPVQAPPVKGGSLEPLQQVAAGTFAKCARCHTGSSAAAGLILDGTSPIDTHAIYRWNQIAGQGKAVPPKMQALISSLTPEQKGDINDALLNLVAEPAQPEPVVDRPPPPPVPNDGGLQ